MILSKNLFLLNNFIKTSKNYVYLYSFKSIFIINVEFFKPTLPSKIFPYLEIYSISFTNVWDLLFSIILVYLCWKRSVKTFCLKLSCGNLKSKLMYSLNISTFINSGKLSSSFSRQNYGFYSVILKRNCLVFVNN